MQMTRNGSGFWRLALVAFISTAISAVASHDVAATAAGGSSGVGGKLLPCQQATGMWGDVDPNIFYICDEHTNTAIAMQCPEGRGFFRGLGYYGCLPYEDWPACTAAPGSLAQTCDPEHLLHPWETTDPNKFYMCVAEALDPVLVNCESGRGFVSAQLASGKIVGCASWEKWRSYMNCEDFY